MRWFLEALKRYSDFAGRSRRSEYWYFVLFYLLIYFALTLVDRLLGMKFGESSSMGVISGLFWLAVLIPALAVSVRRLHDTGRSGWWLLVGLIPLVGVLVLIVFCAQDSDAAANRFGGSPKVSA